MEPDDVRVVVTREGSDKICRSMNEVVVSEPRYLCIIDDELDETSAYRKIDIVLDWLTSRFPEPTKWERQLVMGAIIRIRENLFGQSVNPDPDEECCAVSLGLFRPAGSPHI